MLLCRCSRHLLSFEFRVSMSVKRFRRCIRLRRFMSMYQNNLVVPNVDKTKSYCQTHMLKLNSDRRLPPFFLSGTARTCMHPARRLASTGPACSSD
jgi:hypothetical protein